MRGFISDAEVENVIAQIVSDIRDGGMCAAPGEAGILEVPDDVSPRGFKPFDAAADSDMAAVDGGSSTVLDAGSFAIAGIRVGSARYSGRKYVPGPVPETHLLYLSASDLASAYSIVFSKTVGSEAPDTPRGLDEAAGRVRTLMEWMHLEEVLCQELAPGTVVAFDGALWAGIKGIGGMLERIVRKAREGGVVLCGISKKSMLTHLSRPLIPAVQMAGESAFPGRAWHYPVQITEHHGKLHGEVHVAKLHPHSRFAFRVDLSLPDGIPAEKAMGCLAYHCNDPTYAGYPYPLARVHNDVAFARSEVEDLRRMLRSRAIGGGMGADRWQMTFQDFHEVLDMNR